LRALSTGLIPAHPLKLLWAEMVQTHLLSSAKWAIMVQGESILIKAALNFTHGKRHEAATLLGYGRNTLTRKIQELGI